VSTLLSRWTRCWSNVGWANLVWVAVDARGDRAASLTQRLPHPYHYPLTPTRSAGNAVVSSFNIDRFKWIYAIWGYRRAEKLFA